MLILDYTLNTPEERKEYVQNLLKNYSPNSNELSLLSDYLLFTRDKNQTKIERTKEYSITTPNREQTISKRQISYDGLIEKLENGEDGLYTLISDNKFLKLDNKDPLSEEDKKKPEIAQGLEVIKKLEWQYKNAPRSKKIALKKTIIEVWKQLYLIKGAYQINPSLITNKAPSSTHIDIPEEITYSSDGTPSSNSTLTLLNPQHVSYLLQNYVSLIEENTSNLTTDIIWLLKDLEYFTEKALFQKHPFLWDVLIWKIQSFSNKQIQQLALKKWNKKHTEQYYSSIWRNKIPNLISQEVAKHYITIYFLNNYKIDQNLNWKVCSKCGALLPAHPLFFPRNSNKDGFYSQCRECRNRKEDK